MNPKLRKRKKVRFVSSQQSIWSQQSTLSKQSTLSNKSTRSNQSKQSIRSIESVLSNKSYRTKKSKKLNQLLSNLKQRNIFTDLMISEGNPLRNIFEAMDSVYFHPDRFEIQIDARGYHPTDINCTVTLDGNVEVRGCHRNHLDCSKKTISLIRNYKLPRNVNPQQGVCSLTTDGVLVITAPWM